MDGDPNGRLLALRSGTDRFYVLTDALGSVAASTQAGGTVNARYACGPFGEQTANTAPGFADPVALRRRVRLPPRHGNRAK